MSGGSLDYVYARVEDAAMNVASRAQTPLHRAFAMHLHKVAKALRDLEWMLSCDTAEGSEIEAIRAALPEGAELECATARAREALADLHTALRGAAKWPAPSAEHLIAITFAYEKGFSAGYEDRNTENIFADTGGQREAFDIGLTEGRNRRRETMRNNEAL